MSDFIFAALGTGGDVWPALRIARELHRRGHGVSVLAPEPFAARARADGLNFESVDTRAAWLADVESPAYWGPDGTRLGLAPGGYLRRPVEATFDFIASRAARSPTVVCTRNAYGARFAAECRGLACLCLGYSSTQFFKLGRLPYRHAVLRRSPRWLQAGLLAWGDRSADAMLLPDLNAMRQRHALPAVRRFRDWSFFRHPGMALYPAWYDDVQELAPLGIRQAGFVFAHDADDGPLPAALQGFLDAGPPPMVLTFGTGVGHVVARFAAALELVRRTAWRAIFVSRFEANLPPEAHSHPRIHVVAEADFAALLPRCAVLVHHGGIGTAAQAVRAQIPQVIVPIGYDQPDNGRRLQALRLARLLSGRRFDAAGLEAAVADAIAHTDRARLRQLGDDLRAGDGSRRAADVCEEVAAQQVGAVRQTHE
ncbi:hypothetical protein B9Z45_13200 [Limnohabitans sp. 2KL-17]|uniref:glycosyltransferase n=1 Tax=Limnohabitans sp. 2KL-17 TaxID=1100704 RepID=UPI000D362A91|nr:glycosyltransferase [Limnohabitans sp. 2KL-17]PUE53049.1 hypothetical protein B9Z45_13200 [Limnohabitans sp. 2KL-17]